MFYQIFLSPQLKRCTVITYKHGIYELPHELPNDLRHDMFAAGWALVPTQEKKTSGYQISGKCLNLIES